ncbi:nuclear transport factor 2 family protein [Caballeronia sp. ATUFL_M2_KS44]|uniref:YybH family protein n=1 Tax=Caballeronia sp. ATUFL_M2_KS44 TaxID=2921767 RepID=UPI00202858F5|nr:nuclear transport factor 2 family protein [Caballeronia sp. ATUFL_M2_KS44]
MLADYDRFQAMKDWLEQDILSDVQTRWNVAARRWDAHALTSIYEQDALFFGGRQGQSVGAHEILAYFESYRGVIESACLTFAEQRFIRLTGDCFLAQGFGEFDFVLCGNKATRSRLRTTLVITRRGDTWRIRQHHFSSEPLSPPI